MMDVEPEKEKSWVDRDMAHLSASTMAEGIPSLTICLIGNDDRYRVCGFGLGTMLAHANVTRVSSQGGSNIVNYNFYSRPGIISFSLHAELGIL